MANEGGGRHGGRVILAPTQFPPSDGLADAMAAVSQTPSAKALTKLKDAIAKVRPRGVAPRDVVVGTWTTVGDVGVLCRRAHGRATGGLWGVGWVDGAVQVEAEAEERTLRERRRIEQCRRSEVFGRKPTIKEAAEPLTMEQQAKIRMSTNLFLNRQESARNERSKGYGTGWEREHEVCSQARMLPLATWPVAKQQRTRRLSRSERSGEKA